MFKSHLLHNFLFLYKQLLRRS